MEKEPMITNLANAVKAIYEQDGQVTPSALVEAAKPASSPIHGAFVWDDKRAGHEFRLIQARQHIRRVEIIIEDRPERLVHVPVILNDGPTGEGAYKPESVVCEIKDELDYVLSVFKRQIKTARENYDRMKTLADRSAKKRVVNFKRADKGFDLIESAMVD